MTAPILGDFELIERLGRGGMGEVWAARSLRDGHDAAVKVITDERARQAHYHAAFRNEVRAVAGLDHNGIVDVYDFGRIPDSEAILHAGLVPGSPYLAMERLEPVDVVGEAARRGWPAIRRLLLELLDALAHAHARDVVHRDLKPDNVLRGDGRHKLTDFGVAHAVPRDLAEIGETANEMNTTVGTPAYMAPEQIKGLWRDFGPWTDLYAVGCLAYELACGSPPFIRASPLATMIAQVSDPVPEVVAGVAIPRRFPGWVGRLLAKSPAQRFRRAADAARALALLGDPDEATVVGPRLVSTTDVGTSDTLMDPKVAGTLPTMAQPTQPALEALASLPTVALAPSSFRMAAPVPEKWQTPSDLQRRRRVGLGLFGLRAVPFVGREGLRDALWDTLREVAEAGRPRAFVLDGRSGFGKSRVAEWLCERAHQLGAATVLRAVHTPVGGPAHGLGPMMQRALRCVGLERGDVEARLERVLPDMRLQDELGPIAEIVSPSRSGGRPTTVKFTSPAEQYLTLRRFISALSKRRTVLLWLDDVQWGGRAIDFVTSLLDAPDAPPVMVVATARTEALAKRPVEAARLETLRAREDVWAAEVGALNEEERARLVPALLDVAPGLATAIDARGGGQPLFTVQLVSDWVQRRVLAPGPDGFELRAGAEDELERMPEDLREVWATRVERLLRNRHAADGYALEIAATLGQAVSTREWQGACEAALVEANPELVELLLHEGLAECAAEGPDAGWSFAHGLLREWLETRAAGAGRSPEHHRACATMLAPHLVAPGVASRLAHHWIAAGELERAVEPLAVAIEALLEGGEPTEAEALLGALRRVLESLRVPESDERRGDVMVLASRIAEFSADLERATAEAKKAEAASQQHGWGRVRARIFFQLGVLTTKHGLYAQAEAWLEQALELAEAVEDAALQAASQRQLGMVLLGNGRLDAAEPHLREGLRISQSVRDLVGAGRCDYGLAQLMKRRGNYEAAAVYNRRAQVHLEAAGARNVLGACHNQLGELARAQGDPDAATTHYSDALRVWSAMGSGNAVYAQVNLALVLLDRDLFDGARTALKSALKRFETQRQWSMAAAAHAYLLPSCAAAKDWPAFDLHTEEATRILAETGFADSDAARLARRGADLAETAGVLDRARSARLLARLAEGKG